MKKNNKGFTLVELIIVMAIIAILAAVIAPNLMQYINKSKKTKDIATAETIATAVSAAVADKEGYTTGLLGGTTGQVVSAMKTTATNPSKDQIIVNTIIETLGGDTKVASLKTYNGSDFTVIFQPNNAKSIVVKAGSDEVFPERTGDYAK